MNRKRKLHLAVMIGIACVAALFLLRLLVSDHGLELRMAANAGDLSRIRKLLYSYPKLIDQRQEQGLGRPGHSWINPPQGAFLAHRLFSKYQVNEFQGLLDDQSGRLDSHGPVLNCRFELGEVNGETALHQAVYGRHAEVVEYLCQLGANPNITDRDGAPPLMVAVRTEQDLVVEKLLLAGAKLVPDNSGLSPADHAHLYRNEKIVRLLKLAQQRPDALVEGAKLRSGADEKVESGGRITGPTEPGDSVSVFKELAMAANDIALRGGSLPESLRTQLRPVEVYNHQANVVIAFHRDAEEELGYYVKTLVSSFIPFKDDQGWTWKLLVRPKLQVYTIYEYRRKM